MKKPIALLTLALILTIIILFEPSSVVGADTHVTVTIPEFPITIYNTTIDHQNDKYPFILYKDITYFPMTYKHCAYLGVATAWTARDGLYVAAVESSSGILPDYGKEDNSATSYTAGIVSFPVYVNGKRIDNQREEYPLLIFRDITYFPMTWRFATEEFSWRTSWSPNSGLDIHPFFNDLFSFVSTENESAYLQREETVYAESLDENGEIAYFADYANVYNARLDFSDDSVVSLDSLPEPPIRENEDAGVELRGDSLFFEDIYIKDISELIAINDQSDYGSKAGYPISVISEKTDFDGGY